MSSIHIRQLAAHEPAYLADLCELLIDSVSGGASVSFMQPLSADKAAAFWLGVGQSITRNERTVLVAEDENGRIVGTVQLITDQPENQPHRADVVKLLVHSRARRKGIAQRLMGQLETIARGQGKSTLVLDTTTGSDAELFYQSIGWQRAGELPAYALMPDGSLSSTTFYYKLL